MTEIISKSDQGPRENTEDAARAVRVTSCCPAIPPLIVMVVCDGVGGAACGELASALACQQIVAWVCAAYAGIGAADLAAWDAEAILGLQVQALDLANQTILREAAAQPGRQGMATTVVCAVIFQDVLHVAWLGDSRCYLYQNGTLEQLTHDHSERQELIDAGLFSAEEASLLLSAHVITRFLGHDRPLDPSTCTRPIAQGDVVLLCTDGLTDVVTDYQIGHHIRAHLHAREPFEHLGQGLITSALQADTQDNVTIMACRYSSTNEIDFARANRTRTGAYPVHRARALQRLHKENSHVHSAERSLFD